jgi:hypothetical protein
MAAATVIGLLDLSRRLLRWSVAALYAVAFATIYHFAWSDETRAPTLIIFGIVIGIYGCLLVACSVASVRRAANMKGDKAREPIFGPRAPEFAFKVLCQLAAGFPCNLVALTVGGLNSVGGVVFVRDRGRRSDDVVTAFRVY